MVLLPLVLIPFFLRAVRAAITIEAECSSRATWTFYKGRTPCEVWASLQSVCVGDVFIPELDALSDFDAQYPPPRSVNATACQCNVVAYNLMAGCSWCQPFVFDENVVTEAQWRANCPTYDATGALPATAISLKDSIPPWAFQVQDGAEFDELRAEQIAEASGTASFTLSATKTGASSIFFPTSTRTTRPSFTSFSSGDDFDDEVANTVRRAIGIALGVLAAIWILIYGIILIVFIMRRNKRREWYREIAEYYAKGGRYEDVAAAKQGLAHGGSGHNPFATPMPSGQFNYPVRTPGGSPGPTMSEVNMPAQAAQYTHYAQPWYPNQYPQGDTQYPLQSPQGQGGSPGPAMSEATSTGMLPQGTQHTPYAQPYYPTQYQQPDGQYQPQHAHAPGNMSHEAARDGMPASTTPPAPVPKA